jgi:hypothetical protein
MPLPSLPPALTGRVPMGASPVGAPTGSPGQEAHALAQVRDAVDQLQKAVVNLTIGSDPHKAVLNAIQAISKYVTPSAGVPGVQQTFLRDRMQDAQQSGMMQSLMRSLGGAGASSSGGPTPAPSGGPPGATPPMPAA